MKKYSIGQFAKLINRTKEFYGELKNQDRLVECRVSSNKQKQALERQTENEGD